MFNPDCLASLTSEDISTLKEVGRIKRFKLKKVEEQIDYMTTCPDLGLKKAKKDIRKNHWAASLKPKVLGPTPEKNQGYFTYTIGFSQC